MLLRASWGDARTRLTDVGRLADLLNRSNEAIVHKALDRVSPMSVPLMMIIGRESVRQEATEDMLLAEADALVAEALRLDGSDLRPRAARRRRGDGSILSRGRVFAE